MPQLQPVFDESAEQLASAATPEPAQAAPAEPSEPSQPSEAAELEPPAAARAALGVGPAANGMAADPAIPSAAEVPGAKTATAQRQPSSARENGSATTRVQMPQHSTAAYEDNGDEELDYGDEEDEAVEEIMMDAGPHGHSNGAVQRAAGADADTEDHLSPGAVAPVIGPTMGPLAGSGDAAARELEGDADLGKDAPTDAAPQPRTAGPAMPPPELLAAAQEAALAVSAPHPHPSHDPERLLPDAALHGPAPSVLAEAL